MKRVKAADRTLDLFEAFARCRRPMSLSEIAREIEMPVSSCHVLLGTLVSRGYLTVLEHQRTYYPSKLIFELASTVLAHSPVISIISPFLRKLCDRCGETVVLGKRIGRQVIYLDVHESSQTIRFSARVSTLRDLHSSALGKALLAQMPVAEREELVRQLPMRKVTGHTLTSAKALLANIDQGIQRGWQLTRAESVEDVSAVAQGIELAGEHYAVAIAGPFSRMEPRLEEHARALLETLDALRPELA